MAMRAGTPLLIVLALGLASVWAPIALAHENECPMVLETLAHCVTHHLEAGEILNEGVYLRLLAKADAALAAFNGAEPKPQSIFSSHSLTR